VSLNKPSNRDKVNTNHIGDLILVVILLSKSNKILVLDTNKMNGIEFDRKPNTMLAG
jgi:hypothetical protein